MSKTSTFKVLNMNSLKWIVISDEYNKSQDDDINEVAKSDICIKVEKNATDLLSTKNETVNLISIFGPARTGKSTFMNIIAGVDDHDNEIFKSSSALETVTTGVDISETFLPLREFSKLNDNPEIDSNILVGFIDTEGQGNKGDEFDIYLFSPILVTSKIVIFWWPGMLQLNTILNNLGAITTSAKRITRGTQDQHQNTKPYGHLHIIFSSWNNNNTPDDVKKLLLEPQAVNREKDKEHNSIRELLNDCFESIDIWLFPANGLMQARERLLFEDFNDNWKQTFRDMRKKISEQLSINKPKHSAEKPWTGRDIAEFTELLCKTLTSSENYAITSIFERMQYIRAKTLAKNALNDFRALINEMKFQYKAEGCDYEGISACLCKELEKFKEMLKLESFSDKVVNEIYAIYSKSACLITSDLKTKFTKLIIEVQNLQKQFDEYISSIEFPLLKTDLAMLLNEPTQLLWCDFNEIVRDIPKDLVQQYRKELENFVQRKTQYLEKENEKEIISFAENKMKEYLEKLVKKLEKRLPMKENKLKSEWLISFKQSEEVYFNSYASFNNFYEDTALPGNLHILADSFLESLVENNSTAWENKADEFIKRAGMQFKQALAFNFPVNDKKIFNNVVIEQYLQEEILKFSYKASNIFPHTIMNNIYTKYKKIFSFIVTKHQEENNKNIKENPKKIERYILDWDILLDANVRNDLERWQHEVDELLFISTTIPGLANLPSFQLLCICNDLINLDAITVPSSFRRTVRSILRRDTENMLSEQFVIEILKSLESKELKFVQMLFISRCLGIMAPTFPIRQLFYKLLFENRPFVFASPIIRYIFFTENEKYQEEEHRNAFFDLIKTPQIVFESSLDLKIINDLLRENDLDSKIAALSCDIIQKTFFVDHKLDELHHNFSNAVNSLSITIVEPLQIISAIAFLKEYVRTFCDENKITLKEYVRNFRNKKSTFKAKVPSFTCTSEIIRDINDLMKLKCSRIHSLKIYFLKYLRSCDFSMQDIKDLCESQEQPFPWLKEISWGDKVNRLSFNPYWLHQDYKYAEDYYYHIYNIYEADTNMNFASYLEMERSKMPNMIYKILDWGFGWPNNKLLQKNDLVTFAGVIVVRLHYIRASRKWTDNEKRIVNCLTTEIEAMNVSPIYKNMLKKLLSNSNSLIQLLEEDEVSPEDNTIDEFLMKSVIVHLIILHSSIQNDTSPLAAYLHQLQVCQNDFILTCPSDVEGVVMNAVASFRDDNGAESGVTRYRCICGEKFIVLDCGDFAKPGERNSISISGKCLKCKKVIGYGSIEGDYTRLDAKKITSVPIKHDPGYIVKRISNEKTHNVRMMTPQAYRILHLFVHTLLGASVPSSIASKFFAKNGNSVGCPMKYCLNHIRNDWKILKEIFNCNNEQLALILHSVISSMIKKPASYEWRLDTPEKREEWEFQFSKEIDIPNVVVMTQNIRNKMSKDRISLTEEEIDDILSVKDQKYHHENLLRLWRKIKDVDFKSLSAYYLIDNNNKAKFPFLGVFFRYKKKLHLIKNIFPILKFVQILKTRLEYQITRQEAREMTFDNFISQESNNGELQEISLALNSAFKAFAESWNMVVPYVKRYQCLQFETIPQISYSSSVMFGLAEEKDVGIYLCAIISYLTELQNQFLDETIAIPFGLCRSLKFLETNVENIPSTSTAQNDDGIQYYLQTVQIQHAQPTNFIDYEWNDKILQYSQRNLEIRYGEDIVFDLYQIEKELAHQLVFNKFLISNTFNTSFRFPYYEEMFLRDFNILTNFEKFVAQEPLPIASINSSDLYNHVLDKLFSSENASRMLPALEMIICNVNFEMNGEISIKGYISQQMNLSIFTENAEFCGMFSADLRLKHLISLYERAESMKAFSFNDIDAKYRKPLSRNMNIQILEVIAFEKQFKNQISACELFIALKRFLARYLMAESLEYISTNDKLINYIIDEDLGCWPSSSSLKIAKYLFPSEIQVGQTYSVYELLSSRQTSNQYSV
ncbi:852_t:CDS:2 [Dentiscutata erythropus]|uniref:852_t:CDS:1 n=1 Tax=Dentiscutata erythropus TaxID=1348616 RepID=A0A9N8VER5_9GLOM|nr:852_t:CDS:2 [Dentiscutata erythropus]